MKLRRPVSELPALVFGVLGVATVALTACAGGTGDLTVYSGRSAELVGPLIANFEEATGISVDVKYGSTSGLTATLLEEGNHTPADVFFSQDAGALGVLAAADMFEKLPEDLLSKVDPRFVDRGERWVGTSARSRVVVYNTDTVDPSALPGTLDGYTAPEWSGRVGWAPTNASFQAFVTALRHQRGDAAALEWLKAMKANGVRDYKNNSAIVQAVSVGDIDAGFANHYYLYRFMAEEGVSFRARNHYPAGRDMLGVLNAAGVGVLAASDSRDAALEFVEFLLSDTTQRYFANETFEYPLAAGVDAHPDLPPLESLETPEIDLGDLGDIEATIELLLEAGVF